MWALGPLGGLVEPETGLTRYTGTFFMLRQVSPGFAFASGIQHGRSQRPVLRSWTAGLSLAFPLGSCATLLKLLQLSVPQCPLL